MSKKNRSRWRKLKTAQPPPQQQNPARSVAGEPFPRSSAISEAKLLANRSNAQLSTGAITPEGKAVVSQNATRHGLTGQFKVLPNESQEDFDQLLAAFLRDEAPADQEEIEMVHFMAEATWLSRRSIRLQDQAIILIENGTPEGRKEGHRNLALYLRYMTTHDRAYSRYAAELRKRRNERRKTERGFVSQRHREAAEHRREANEIRKKELHDLRQQTQILRQQRVEINNRIAAAKAERLELENESRKSAQTLSAAA
jgi:hypothetical protein